VCGSRGTNPRFLDLGTSSGRGRVVSITLPPLYPCHMWLGGPTLRLVTVNINVVPLPATEYCLSGPQRAAVPTEPSKRHPARGPCAW
jgi:hypothetical protein